MKQNKTPRYNRMIDRILEGMDYFKFVKSKKGTRFIMKQMASYMFHTVKKLKVRKVKNEKASKYSAYR